MKCKKLNHVAEARRSSLKRNKAEKQVYQSDSEEDTDRILISTKLQ